MRVEVRVAWEQNENGFVLIGSVLVDGKRIRSAYMRNILFGQKSFQSASF